MSPLPWHEEPARGLEQRLAAGELPHALLITGPEGWGERHLTEWLALRLLGLDPDLDAAAVAHPDLRWIEPDGAVIKVEDVREIVAFAHGTPQSGPRKAVVVADAHYLNRSSANALLKTLEEPPAGTHVLLYSAHPGRLLPTIRSRCQVIAIRPDAAAARRWLEAQAGVDDLERRLFEHGGAPVAVMAGVERGERPLEALLEDALQPGRTEAMVKAMIAEPGLADCLGRWYRYVLALAAGQWQRPALAGVPRRALLAFADELLWARRLMVTSNSPNARLLAERIVARWRHLGQRAGK